MTTVVDIAVDLETGDLDFQAQKLQMVDDLRATAQRLRQRLGTWYGEWFLDQRVGLRYREDILVKSPDMAVVSALIKQQILTVPSVTGLLEFRLDWNQQARALSVTFKASTEFGELEAYTGESMTPGMLILLFRWPGSIYPV